MTVKRYSTEIIAQTVQFVGGAAGAGAGRGMDQRMGAPQQSSVNSFTPPPAEYVPEQSFGGPELSIQMTFLSRNEQTSLMLKSLP